jgi:phosphate transport system permease protein
MAAVAAIVLIFLGMFVALLVGAAPALMAFGPGFFTADHWDPVRELFGGRPAIVGTLVTSGLAMAIATPLGIGVAVFLTELCPRLLRQPIGIAIELLAGIPSIIYGIWGFFVFAPWFQRTLEPALIDLAAPVPGLNLLLAGPPFGIGIFTAAVVLAIMVLPFITAITRDVFAIVPAVLKEAAYGLGCTGWEVIWRVVLPYSRAGVVGGVMLALGRALGETMAVTFVVGNAHKLHASVLAPGTTISATIANEFTEAVGPLYYSSLLALGLFLMFVTFLVLALAQWMLRRTQQRTG